MKKFELGLFTLCILLGAAIGEAFGVAVAIAAHMMISGLVEQFTQYRKQNNKRIIDFGKKEAK